MKRKRLAPLVFAILFFSGVISVFADSTGNTPSSGGDDSKILPRFDFFGTGAVAVTGSSEDSASINVGSTDSWTFTLLGVQGKIEQAWLYIGIYDSKSTDTTSWNFNLTHGGITVSYLNKTTPYDQDVAYELFRYDVTAILPTLGLSVNGLYTLDVKHVSGSNSDRVYGVGIVVVYSHPSLPLVCIWINDGCEFLLGNVTTSTDFKNLGQPPGGGSSTLYTMVGGGNPGFPFDDDEVYFDGYLLATGAFDSSNGFLFDVDSFNVQPYMGAGAHSASFYANYDGYFVYTAVLSYNPYLPIQVIPETPFGNFTAALMMLLGLAFYTLKKGIISI
ncbi:DUF3344 domain-containing protein [Candidatus Bathyarchaeota archaeon]|nr:DUF3344 domain-containing protein [Candidatus Bathyarchaeota archaeon]